MPRRVLAQEREAFLEYTTGVSKSFRQFAVQKRMTDEFRLRVEERA